MAGIFLSYSRSDLKAAQTLQAMLEAEGVKVWRDQESIYAGEKWPKAMGEGIAGQSLFVLLWSHKAATSHFVEFEWNTAIALKKTIIPVVLDDTSLPPLLRAINAVSFSSPPETKNRILQQLQKSPQNRDMQQKQVLKKLEDIQNKSPKEVNKITQSLYHQEGWTVQGNVYHISGENVNISMGENENITPKKWYKRWETWVASVATVVTAVILVYYFSKIDKQGEFPLTIYIHGQDGASDVLDYGTVRVRLGQYRLPPKEVDAQGEVYFEGIPIKYIQDSVHLELLSRPYMVLHQSAYTPNESQRITFEVRPEYIQVRGTVYENAERIAGAIVEFDSGLARDTTDAQGNFNLIVPKGEGDLARISITYNKQERFRRNMTLSAREPMELTLDPIPI